MKAMNRFSILDILLPSTNHIKWIKGGGQTILHFMINISFFSVVQFVTIISLSLNYIPYSSRIYVIFIRVWEISFDIIIYLKNHNH